jgi:hypothetical protein
MTHLRPLLLTTALLATAPAFAANITVLPSDVAATPVLNQWNLSNFRGTSNLYSSTTTAGITTANPRNGNGSVQMSLTDGSGKADYAYTWGYDSARTLGTLTSLSYDWYRTGASIAGLMPAFRLFYDADGSAATTGDQGYLVFEQTYNGGAGSVVSDQWVSTDLMNVNMWQRQFTPGLTVEAYNVSLADWTSGTNQPANADRLNASTAILGIEFGIGSGWNGAFNGFVDNVSFGFGGNTTTFNFETAAAAAVPEPGSIALLGMGVLGLVATRRRKAAGK